MSQVDFRDLRNLKEEIEEDVRKDVERSLRNQLEEEYGPYNVTRRREKTRTTVMLLLLGILGTTILGALVLSWFQKEASTFIQTVFPSLTTLVGSALGFYFGGKEGNDQNAYMRPPPSMETGEKG